MESSPWIVRIFIGTVLLVLLLAFPFSRNAVIWLLKEPVYLMLHWLWHLSQHVIRAHMVVLRNFAPRGVVQPTLARPTTGGG